MTFVLRGTTASLIHDGRRWLAVTVVVALVLIAGARANAQPVNDACTNAIVIGSLPFSDSQDTTSATTELTDPIHPNCTGTQEGFSVWYSFTPAVNGTIQFDTTDSSYQAFVTVYTGSCGGLTQVADFCSAVSSWFEVTAGTTYLIEVTDYYTSGGTLDIAFSAVPPPSSDSCSTPTVINPNALPYTSPAIDTRGASTAPSDPVQSCTNSQNTKSVWFSYTAPTDGFINVSSSYYVGTNYQTNLSVYTGACGALTEIACINYYFTQPTPVRVRAGQTLLFEVSDRYSDGGGSLTFYAELGHDSVIKALSPPTETIPLNKDSITKTLQAVVTNADLNDAPPGHQITVSHSGTCTISSVAFPAKLPKGATPCQTPAPNCVTLEAGKSVAATVTLQFSKDNYFSPNSKSPDRCSVSLSVGGPTYYDGNPNNNETTFDINVVDKHDF
ncbi:MAG TPA: hypothetical protein VMW56_24625 [Candidatus Margulisiibacteriota bacterium]|nr:hypothetical protein [Candidatus Margulisiibacteriota bacterium]